MDWTDYAFNFIGRGVEVGMLLSFTGWFYRMTITKILGWVLGA